MFKALFGDVDISPIDPIIREIRGNLHSDGIRYLIAVYAMPYLPTIEEVRDCYPNSQDAHVEKWFLKKGNIYYAQFGNWSSVVPMVQKAFGGPERVLWILGDDSDTPLDRFRGHSKSYCRANCIWYGESRNCKIASGDLLQPATIQERNFNCIAIGTRCPTLRGEVRSLLTHREYSGAVFELQRFEYSEPFLPAAREIKTAQIFFVCCLLAWVIICICQVVT